MQDDSNNGWNTQHDEIYGWFWYEISSHFWNLHLFFLETLRLENCCGEENTITLPTVPEIWEVINEDTFTPGALRRMHQVWTSILWTLIGDNLILKTSFVWGKRCLSWLAMQRFFAEDISQSAGAANDGVHTRRTGVEQIGDSPSSCLSWKIFAEA